MFCFRVLSGYCIMCRKIGGVNFVFLIDSTYKTNRYKLPLLEFVGVTPTGMTFSADFAYLEGERVNNVVWALEWF